MTKVLCISNQKGGTGKTTTAVNLAHGLAKRGKSVLLIDLDPQGNCAILLKAQPSSAVYDFLVRGTPINKVVTSSRPNLWMLTGDKRTASIIDFWKLEAKQDDTDLSVNKLRSCLRPLFNKDLHYILLDTNPSMGGLQDQALWAADSVLVPASTNYLGAVGLAKIYETMLVFTKKGWNGTLLGVLPTFLENSNDSRDIYEKYEKNYGAQVLEPIHKATILAECAGEGKTIWEKRLIEEPEKRASREYESLVNKVIGAL